MKASLEQIALYALCFAEKLPRYALPKLIYLLDYQYSLTHGEQYTNIKWYYNDFGPFVHDVENAIRKHENVKISKEKNPYDGKGCSYFYYAGVKVSLVDSEAASILEGMVSLFRKMTSREFISYVYGTYPMAHTSRHNFIDVSALALQEMDEMSEEAWYETVRDYGEVLTALAK